MVAFWYNQPGNLLRFKNYLFLFSFLVPPTNKSTTAHIIISRINILLYKPSSSVHLCSIKILLAKAQGNPCAIEGITQGNMVILVQIQALRFTNLNKTVLYYCSLSLRGSSSFRQYYIRFGGFLHILTQVKT